MIELIECPWSCDGVLVALTLLFGVTGITPVSRICVLDIQRGSVILTLGVTPGTIPIDVSRTTSFTIPGLQNQVLGQLAVKQVAAVVKHR